MSKPLIHKDNNSEIVLKSMDNETGYIEGYASVYSVLDSDLEYLDPGVFRRSLTHNKGKVPILFGHNRDQVAGWAHSGVEDAKGLFVTGKLNLETEAGKKAYYLLKGAIEAGATDYATLSVGFIPEKGDGVYKDKEGRVHYKSCALREWSVVPFASNPEAYATSIKQVKEYSDIVGKEDDTAEEQQKEPPVANTQTKETATGPITFEAALSQQKSEDPDRLRIENALHASLDSILDANIGKGEQKILIHKAQHCYADAVSDWTGKQMDLTEESLGKVLAIKGMATENHVDQQRRMAKAKVHLDESSAQRVSSEAHAVKAHKYVHEAIQAYSAADVQAPNGPAVGTGKKDDSTVVNTKSEEFDLTALLTALAVPQ